MTARLNTKVVKDKVPQAVEVTISAAPVGTTASGDFTQNGTVLTIPAGQKTSTGTVTISAVDDDVDGPDKHLVVTGGWPWWECWSPGSLRTRTTRVLPCGTTTSPD